MIVLRNRNAVPLARESSRVQRSHASLHQRPHCRYGAVGTVPRASPVVVDAVEGVEEVTHTDVAVPKFPHLETGRFINAYQSFSEDFRLRAYEVGFDQGASIVSIGNIIQEVAGNHAVGMWGRADNGFANMPFLKDIIFVMTRQQIRMASYPKWGDVVRVETYFAEDGRLGLRRDWTLTNAMTGEVYGAATSTFVTINLATRRLAKLPDDMKKKFLKLSPAEERIAIPLDESKLKLPAVEFGSEIEPQKHVAGRSDMDMNGHINNVTYLAWVVDCIPDSVLSSYQLSEVEIDFKNECLSGDIVEVLTSQLETKTGGQVAPGAGSTNGSANGSTNGSAPHPPVEMFFLHLLRKCDVDGKCTDLVKSRTTWKRIEKN